MRALLIEYIFLGVSLQMSIFLKVDSLPVPARTSTASLIDTRGPFQTNDPVEMEENEKLLPETTSGKHGDFEFELPDGRLPHRMNDKESIIELLIGQNNELRAIDAGLAARLRSGLGEILQDEQHLMEQLSHDQLAAKEEMKRSKWDNKPNRRPTYDFLVM